MPVLGLVREEVVWLGSGAIAMARPIEQIEAEALELDEKDRARLAHQLLLSLEPALKDQTQVEKVWIEEAVRRRAELESADVIL